MASVLKSISCLQELTMKTLCGIGVLSAALLVGCSSAQSDWSQANASNTVAAYQRFLDQHPNTTQAVVARNRIHALEDQQAWAQAQQANTLQAFQTYLREQPSGIHVAEAKDRMAANERMTAWTADVDPGRLLPQVSLK